jgi:transcription initiation factor TFIIIB Brf1 subunit/transcription initiation factor TFIIB
MLVLESRQSQEKGSCMNNFPSIIDLAANVIGVLCFIVLCWKYVFGFRKEFKEFRNWKNQRKKDQSQYIVDVTNSTDDDLHIVLNWLKKKQQEGHLVQSQLSKVRNNRNHLKVAFKLAMMMLKEALHELDKATSSLDERNRVIDNFLMKIEKLKVLVYDLMIILNHEKISRAKQEEIKRKYEMIILELNSISSYLIEQLKYRDDQKI